MNRNQYYWCKKCRFYHLSKSINGKDHKNFEGKPPVQKIDPKEDEEFMVKLNNIFGGG